MSSVSSWCRWAVPRGAGCDSPAVLIATTARLRTLGTSARSRGPMRHYNERQRRAAEARIDVDLSCTCASSRRWNKNTHVLHHVATRILPLIGRLRLGCFALIVALGVSAP